MEPSKNLNYKIHVKAVQSDLDSLFFYELEGFTHWIGEKLESFD